MATRGITDPIEEHEDKNKDTEFDETLRNLIISHNMLHDRLVRLEALVDSFVHNPSSVAPETKTKKWKRGL